MPGCADFSVGVTGVEEATQPCAAPVAVTFGGGGEKPPDTIVMKKVIGSRARDPAFAMPDEASSMSITDVRIWRRLQRSSNEETDRAMFIVDGNGDFILIPRGVPYECSGIFTYLVINSPAYREGTDSKGS